MHTQCTLASPPYSTTRLTHTATPYRHMHVYTLPSEPPSRTLEGVGGVRRKGDTKSPPGRAPFPPSQLAHLGCACWVSPSHNQGAVGKCAHQKVLGPRGQPGISRRWYTHLQQCPPLPALFLAQRLTVLEVTAEKGFTVHLRPSPSHLHHQMFLVGEAVEKVRAYQSHTASWWPPAVFTASEPCAPTHCLWSRVFGGFQGIRTPLRI